MISRSGEMTMVISPDFSYIEVILISIAFYEECGKIKSTTNRNLKEMFYEKRI